MAFRNYRLSDADPPQTKIDIQLEDELNDEGMAIDLPEELTILPLRGMVVYPQTAIPLTVGQERSSQFVDDVVA